MENLHHLLDTINPGTSRYGLTACLISLTSTCLAFISIHQVQTLVSIAASLVAITSGCFAITYYLLQIKKLNK